MDGEVQPLIHHSSCSHHHHKILAEPQQMRSDDIEQLTSSKKPSPATAASITQPCTGIKACGLSKNTPADAQARAHVTKKLLLALGFCMVFMVVEIVGGFMSNSLAILADAAHLLSDVASFGVALFSVWASSWKPSLRWSYGFHRLEILGALFSVLIIWLVSGILVYEAIHRLLNEVKPIDGKLMFFIAIVGLLANLVMIFILGHHHHHGHSHEHHHGHTDSGSKKHACGEENEDPANLNLRGAYLHILGDLIQSIGVLVGGGIIWLNPRLRFVDVICTLFFSVVVVSTTLKLVRDVLEILMEGIPRGIDAEVIESGLQQLSGVVGVHELHIWSATTGKVLLSCHLTVKHDANSEIVLEHAISFCELQHGIRHVTVQIEREHA